MLFSHRANGRTEGGEDEKEETLKKLRACAMCVKEIALIASDDEEEEELEHSMGRIRLRERKTIERKIMRESNKSSNHDTDTSTNKNDKDDVHAVDASNRPSNDDNDDSDDPFLKAVGGASQLLTGEAYQKKLLEQQQ